MATSRAASVAAYLEELEPERRSVLRALRALVRRARPGARELMFYGMPGYVEGERWIVGFCAQRRHYSLYVCEAKLVARYAARLSACDLGKGCIRFTRLEQLPQDVIEELVRSTQGMEYVPKKPASAAARKRAGVSGRGSAVRTRSRAGGAKTVRSARG